MDKIVVYGGNTLCGEVRISGSKNAALPLMAASLLTGDKCVLRNLPNLRDILTMTAVLRTLGAECIRDQKKRTIRINTKRVRRYEAPYDLVRTMRASVVVLGPLLSRYGEARVSLPGGCAIGTRPIDIHLSGLEKMGASISVNQGYIEALAPKGLRGAEIHLNFPSVGATQNIMMAATLAKGQTVIKNAAREPEIRVLADLLNSMGGSVTGGGTDTLSIEGVKNLKGFEFTVPPDRIEAGTFLVAGALTGGQVRVSPVIPEENEPLVKKMEEMGFKFDVGVDSITVLPGRPKNPVQVQTRVYPGFPTDMQAQLMVLCCMVKGTSVITETIFENRFMHVNELKRLGADITIEGRSAIINGNVPLVGAPVMASDLRASAALILAGLVAEGKTEVLRVYHIDRGYETFEKKLSRLGAKIRRIRDQANVY